MTNDRATTAGDAAGDEPGLTQKNSATVLGEETLANDDADTDDGTGADSAGTDTATATDTEAVLDGTTSTRTQSGAIPSSYGAAGGTTDAYEEGAGESDAQRSAKS